MSFRRSTCSIGFLGLGLAMLIGCVPLTVPSSTEPTAPAMDSNSSSIGVESAPSSPAASESVESEESEVIKSEATETDRPSTELGQTPVAETQAQYLPISAEAEINGQTIQLEVARTLQEQAKGLMYRPPLPDDRGMLFPFDPPRPVQFWMKNTPSPLDMVFLRDGEVQAIVTAAPPCEADPCPTYGPETSVAIDHVLELRSGRAAELGLTVGDRLEIQLLN